MLTKAYQVVVTGTKRIAVGAAAGISYLVGVWGESTAVDQAFDLTAQQWGLLALTVLGAWGVGKAASK